MKAIRDRSLGNSPALEGDLGAYFEHLWRQVDKREKRETNSDPAERKVRLDCTDELVDVRSIGLVVVRNSTGGAELIEFLCPRCGRLHESIAFSSAPNVR